MPRLDKLTTKAQRCPGRCRSRGKRRSTTGERGSRRRRPSQRRGASRSTNGAASVDVVACLGSRRLPTRRIPPSLVVSFSWARRTLLVKSRGRPPVLSRHASPSPLSHRTTDHPTSISNLPAWSLRLSVLSLLPLGLDHVPQLQPSVPPSGELQIRIARSPSGTPDHISHLITIAHIVRGRDQMRDVGSGRLGGGGAAGDSVAPLFVARHRDVAKM
jgi:hypothetical protein